MTLEEANIALNYIAETYGLDAQLDKTKEELGELNQAINEYKGFHENEDQRYANLIDEIADVIIMTSQLEILLNAGEDVRKRVAYKLYRQIDRIQPYKDCAGKDCESDKYCNKCALFPDICHGFKADCQIGKVKK